MWRAPARGTRVAAKARPATIAVTATFFRRPKIALTRAGTSTYRLMPRYPTSPGGLEPLSPLRAAVNAIGNGLGVAATSMLTEKREHVE